jgi:hypothetical protein
MTKATFESQAAAERTPAVAPAASAAAARAMRRRAYGLLVLLLAMDV